MPPIGACLVPLFQRVEFSRTCSSKRSRSTVCAVSAKGAGGRGAAGFDLDAAWRRVVCLIDPVGDVYACPFAIHDNFLAGNVRSPGGFRRVWQHSELFAELRRPQTGGACRSCSAFDSCRGGCMAAKLFTGLPLDGPDPECVKGYGAAALAATDTRLPPRPSADHSHRRRSGPVPLSIGPRPAPPGAGYRACDENPLAGIAAAGS
jgi:radical SAM protein with 4Fe4S-binding SPASM domain